MPRITVYGQTITCDRGENLCSVISYQLSVISFEFSVSSIKY
ncbi:MAG: hypothetical protein ACK47N_10850 [Microcystis sp.]